MNHIEWKDSNPCLPGPVTVYGYWEGAKCFSIHWSLTNKSDKPNPNPYTLKSALPGFRQDLPPQKSVAEAQAFAERMLQRWAAKRGLIFKSHIIVTDAMRQAAQLAWCEAQELKEGEAKRGCTNAEVDAMIKAALEARG